MSSHTPSNSRNGYETEKSVQDEMRRMFREGHSRNSIAQQLGTSDGTVYRFTKDLPQPVHVKRLTAGHISHLLQGWGRGWAE